MNVYTHTTCMKHTLRLLLEGFCVFFFLLRIVVRRLKLSFFLGYFYNSILVRHCEVVLRSMLYFVLGSYVLVEGECTVRAII